MYIHFGVPEFGLRVTVCSHGCPRHGRLESRGFWWVHRAPCYLTCAGLCKLALYTCPWSLWSLLSH